MKTIITLLLSSCYILTMAQTTSNLGTEEQMLKNLTDTIRLSRSQDLRIAAADTFLQEFERVLHENSSSFEESFDFLTSISKIYPADSTFRIMTWQLYVNKDEYKYFGIIQHRKSPTQITVLHDFSRRIRKPMNKELTANNWFGALYYGIQSFKTKQGTKYALFGYNAYKFYEKRKLMDILSFNEKGEPIFGEPLIEYTIRRKDVPPKTETYHRFMLEYPSDVVASIKYDDAEKMILFDHLIPMQSTFPDIPVVMVPDGSYEGFRWKKGKWQHVEKIFHQMSDEAPRPAPLFDSSKKKKKRDLFGRKR